MIHSQSWTVYILPAPILYLCSVILAGFVLSLLLKKQKPRRPSLVAAWLGATLAALVPLTLYAFMADMLEDSLMASFPVVGGAAGAVLVILSLRRIFGTSTGRSILMYIVCFLFQAAAGVPIYLIYRSQLKPAFFVYCILLIVSLPIFLAFRKFSVPEQTFRNAG